WGHRFAYAVDTNATGDYAFTAIAPPEYCGLTVYDSTGTSGYGRSGVLTSGSPTQGAIYVLMSYGPDGHGSYSPASKINAGVTNSQTLTNCHCDSSANSASYFGQYFQRSAKEDSTGGYDVFDDVVRFKERSELQSYDDTYRPVGRLGPYLAVGY